MKPHANKLRETALLAILSLTCFGISMFRHFYSDTKAFLFLNWNLFLALVPWLLITAISLWPKGRQSKWIVGVALGTWLLFFPNAPYILTDLFHVNLSNTMPVWFDLVMILSFAWTGLLYGLLSLWEIERIMGQWLRPRSVVALSNFLLFVGAFGIYVGRYLRWNSWDIITEPFNVVYDISGYLSNPFTHPRTWGMTLFFGIFLNMVYWSFQLLRSRNT